jgi:uncharacterized membrane protein YdjX (TVP38/TMEM64 family)
MKALQWRYVVGFIAVSALLLLLLLVTVWPDETTSALRTALLKVSKLNTGYAGVAFVAIYALSCILLLPGFVLTFGGGVVFGLFPGVLYVILGLVLGAVGSFLLSRYLFRDAVAHYVAKTPKVSSIVQSAGTCGWRCVLLARLCPGVPFRISNYVFGSTKVSFPQFFLGTAIGVIPSAFLYVYIGSLLGDIAKVGSLDALGDNELKVYIGGIVALVAVSIGLFLYFRPGMLAGLKSGARTKRAQPSRGVV